MNETEELEKQYSPSRWSKRYSAEEVIQKHVEFITEGKKRFHSRFQYMYILTNHDGNT